MTGRMLTIGQAADQVQCSERTIRRAIKSGALRAHQVGESKTWRIQQTALDDWLERCANRPADQAAAGAHLARIAAGRARGDRRPRPRQPVGHLSVADLDSPKAGA